MRAASEPDEQAAHVWKAAAAGGRTVNQRQQQARPPHLVVIVDVLRMAGTQRRLRWA